MVLAGDPAAVSEQTAGLKLVALFHNATSFVGHIRPHYTHSTKRYF
jgi:hypothetical protein